MNPHFNVMSPMHSSVWAVYVDRHIMIRSVDAGHGTTAGFVQATSSKLRHAVHPMSRRIFGL